MAVIDDTAFEAYGKSINQELRHRAQVRAWLYFTSFVLLCLVVVGGATRLTDSGLSITEWNPINGVIPPLTEAQWQAELELYRQIPEYQLQNRGMSMAEFQFIYWWEWGHRFLARILGVIFAVPLVFFWLTGRLDKRIKLPLVVLLALGGVQGFIGWWMVSSGLVERVDVSHYRLAVHLTLAGIILMGLIWVARSIAPHADDLPPTSSSNVMAGLLAFATLIQIYLGAMVAGLDAGLASNTWPLMYGQFFPSIVWEPSMGWRNWVENPAIIQFTHRTWGYILFGLYLMHMITSLRWAASSTHARRSVLLFVLICVQIAIGVATLWTQVALSWALAHQAVGFITLGFAVAHWCGLKGALPLLSGTNHNFKTSSASA